MLRVHFTAEDLLATRFATTPAPLLQLVLAVAMTQRRGTDALFEHWRHGVRERLPRRAGPMFALVPANGGGPLFLDPISDSLGDSIELVRSSSDELVSTELHRVCTAYLPRTPWIRLLADRDRQSWQELVDAVATAHDVIVAPDWARVCASHRADLDFRTHLLAELGLRECLTSLYRGACWVGTVLEIPSPSDRDIHLGGRGATLMPSPYWTSHPLFGVYPDGSTMFVYPAVNPLPLVDHQPGGERLTALLGRTRAAVLRALVEHRTTTELARHLSISPAAASEHAKTLRESGLVATQRDGKAVQHSCTSLGLTLLRGDPPADHAAEGTTQSTPASCTLLR